MSGSATNNTRQAAWIALASFFSFGFTVVSSMILSRYFTKADYGTYMQVQYVYHTLLMVFTLGLPKAFSYFLPRVELSQAKSLIRKITNLFFLLGGVFSILLFVGATLIAGWMKNPDLANGLRVFSIVPILMLPTMGLEGILATYKKTFFMVIYTIITRSVMLICVSVPVIFWNGGYIDSIIGFGVASVVAFASALYFKYYPVRNEKYDVCRVSYREILKFSLPLLFASLWGVCIQSADQFFISRFFGNEVFAEFSNGSMELPFVGMITGACAAVLSPIFSRLSYEKVDFKKEVLPLWLSVFEKASKLIYPLVLYCLFFSDIVMVVLYGGQYENSGMYFRLKLFVNFFTVVLYAPFLINTNRVRFYQNVHMYGFIVLVVLEYLSVLFFNSPYVITIVSVICKIGRILCMLFEVARIFQVKFHQIFPVKLIVKIIVPSLFILMVLRFFIDNYFLMKTSSLVIFVTTLIIYTISFYLYSIIAHLDYQSVIKPFFKKI